MYCGVLFLFPSFISIVFDAKADWKLEVKVAWFDLMGGTSSGQILVKFRQ
jgi:hypothetical protein